MNVIECYAGPTIQQCRYRTADLWVLQEGLFFFRVIFGEEKGSYTHKATQRPFSLYVWL
jgi:hypothetical protein